MNKQKIERDLKELCRILISEFDNLKKEGLITEREYEKHTKTKIKFLNERSK